MPTSALNPASADVGCVVLPGRGNCTTSPLLWCASRKSVADARQHRALVENSYGTRRSSRCIIAVDIFIASSFSYCNPIVCCDNNHGRLQAHVLTQIAYQNPLGPWADPGRMREMHPHGVCKCSRTTDFAAHSERSFASAILTVNYEKVTLSSVHRQLLDPPVSGRNLVSEVKCSYWKAHALPAL